LESLVKVLDFVPSRHILFYMEPRSYPQQVASEVRASIARAGVTATDVAKATGMSKATLSRKLRGFTPFNAEDLASIAAVVDAQPSDFLPDLPLGSAA